MVFRDSKQWLRYQYYKSKYKNGRVKRAYFNRTTKLWDFLSAYDNLGRVQRDLDEHKAFFDYTYGIIVWPNG